MKISEFAEKYGVDRRSIDYWTNIGLLHPDETSIEGSYRVYGKKAEEEIKKILIAKAMGGSPLEKYVDLLDHLPANLWERVVVAEIENEIRRVTSSYRLALKWAQEMKESR